jgi:hypothetical protein
MIITKFDYNDLLISDKDALMIAARILGYGKDYSFIYNGQEVTVDLTTLKEKPLDTSLIKTPKVNEFSFTLPSTGNEITFKLLTQGDDKKIEAELEGLKKINPKDNPEVSTRLKHIMLSINGNREPKTIREFVDNAFLAKDARAFREYLAKISPGIELKFNYTDNEGNVEEDVALPIGINFFWPDA